MFCGSPSLCADCEKKLKWLGLKEIRQGRPVYILYEQNQELERLMIRILRYHDLAPAKIFLEGRKEQKPLLQKYPVKTVGLHFQTPELQAFFPDIRLKEAQPTRTETKNKPAGKNRFILKKGLAPIRCFAGGWKFFTKTGYIQLSLFALNEKEMEILLADPQCKGIWMLMQKPENLPDKKQSRLSYVITFLQS